MTVRLDFQGALRDSTVGVNDPLVKPNICLVGAAAGRGSSVILLLGLR